VAKNNTIIAAYATRHDRPDLPFWPMLFDNVTIRLIGHRYANQSAWSAHAKACPTQPSKLVPPYGC
jgi:NADPH2:quinone reductase